MKKSKNKGELSEYYVLLKVLGDGQLLRSDKELKLKPDDFYLIKNILRQLDNQDSARFIVIPERNVIKIKNLSSGDETEIAQRLFSTHAQHLLNTIQTNKKNLTIKDEQFRQIIGAPKAKETSGQKGDITLTIHDNHSGKDEELNFSIKSRLGGSSSLFNASGNHTNFIYEIKNTTLSDTDIEAFNKSKHLQKNLQTLIAKGASLNFIDVVSHDFKQNLYMVDHSMPTILGELVKIYYTSKLKRTSELTAALAEANPLGLKANLTSRFYTHKIKDFLISCALGMTAQKVWQGEVLATGGYIIVKEDGELACFLVYHWNHLKDYMIEKTFLDTASRGRHFFGELYRENNKLYIKLGLLIRFI